jgi:hypothetical protein
MARRRRKTDRLARGGIRNFVGAAGVRPFPGACHAPYGEDAAMQIGSGDEGPEPAETGNGNRVGAAEQELTGLVGREEAEGIAAKTAGRKAYSHTKGLTGRLPGCHKKLVATKNKEQENL